MHVIVSVQIIIVHVLSLYKIYYHCTCTCIIIIIIVHVLYYICLFYSFSLQITHTIILSVCVHIMNHVQLLVFII